MSFSRHLGGLGAILEASWASWGRPDGGFGRLGVLGNAQERPTIFGWVWGQDRDLRPQGQVKVFRRFWGPTVRPVDTENVKILRPDSKTET